MIRVENLTKRYGKAVAVDDVSFSIETGSIVGFLGPNGAGKTTTMRMLTCFLPPTSGSIIVDGLDVIKDSIEIRRRIGYLPETAPLYTDMRVNEYLQLRARLKGLKGKVERDRLAEVLDTCGLRQEFRTIIGCLSKGYRQRVALADALINDPPILILDEPTIGLDPNQIRDVRGLIRNLAGRHTVILSSHILSEVEATCSRVLIMNRGRIVASDTSDHLSGLLKGTVRVVCETMAPPADVLALCGTVPGVVKTCATADGDWTRVILECEQQADVRADLCKCIAARGWQIRELTRERKGNLEDVFVALTKEGDAE